MRSLSASNRGVLFFFFALVASCAPRQTIVPVLEPVVTLEGEISLSASSADGQGIVLSDAGGAICSLQGGKYDLELRNLAGLGARVTGRLGGMANGLPEFLVEWYDLLPIDGHAPVIGLLESCNGGLCLVAAGNVTSYRLEGPLVQALDPFMGYKVWIAGDAHPEPNGGRRATLAVESYGVLLPPGALIRSP